MPNRPLTPAIADAVLLGLAMLTDADAEVPQLEAPEQETVIGLLTVALLALDDVMKATGENAGAALSEVRATGLSMAAEDFAESAETMWAAGLLEASHEWPDRYAANAVTALRHAAGGLGGVATILMLMAATRLNLSEQALIDKYRAFAIESLAAA